MKVILKKPSVVYGKEGCRKNYRECHPCLKTCSTVEKLCYCKDPACNSGTKDWGSEWETEPLSDPFIGVDCSEFERLLTAHGGRELLPSRIHEDF